jgi:hypothetical protein
VPTPNTRNEQMLREAGEFAPHVREFEHAARVYGGELLDYLAALRPVLDAPLPRAWRFVPGTDLCEPIRHEHSHGHPRCACA